MMHNKLIVSVASGTLRVRQPLHHRQYIMVPSQLLHLFGRRGQSEATSCDNMLTGNCEEKPSSNSSHSNFRDGNIFAGLKSEGARIIENGTAQIAPSRRV